MTERMEAMELTRAEVARRSGVALNTYRDFLDGRKWPMDRTAEAIEKALAWPVGSIASIAQGGPVPRTEDSQDAYSATGPGVPTVGSDLSSIVVVMPTGWRDGLSDLEAAEIETAVKLEALRLARELKASRARREEPAQ